MAFVDKFGAVVGVIIFLPFFVSIFCYGVFILFQARHLIATIDGRYTNDIRCSPVDSSNSSHKKSSCNQGIVFRIPNENSDRCMRRTMSLRKVDGVYEPAPYASGTTVLLHYDPNDPKNSVTVKNDRVLFGIGMIIGGTVGFLFVGFFFQTRNKS